LSSERLTELSREHCLERGIGEPFLEACDFLISDKRLLVDIDGGLSFSHPPSTALSLGNGPLLSATLSFCHPDRSEPGFPATQRETKARMRLSLKERRMKSANAIKTYRKSGVAQGRDLRCAIRVPHIYRCTTTLFFIVSGKPTRPDCFGLSNTLPGKVRGVRCSNRIVISPAPVLATRGVGAGVPAPFKPMEGLNRPPKS
jgi:hypothetical protein